MPELEVHNALLSGNPQDHFSIAYHLIIDNKRIADETAKLDMKDFYFVSSSPIVNLDPNHAPLLSTSAKLHPERMST